MDNYQFKRKSCLYGKSSRARFTAKHRRIIVKRNPLHDHMISEEYRDPIPVYWGVCRDVNLQIIN